MRSRRVGSAGTGVGTNNTHPSLAAVDADELALEFRATAVGATPTVTFQWQGSDDDPSTPDASSDWYPIFATPSGGAADVNAGGTVTAVGVTEFFLNLRMRPINKVRLVTSANTNVTYDSEVRALSDEA